LKGHGVKNTWSVFFVALGVIAFIVAMDLKMAPVAPGLAIAAGLCVLAAGVTQIHGPKPEQDDECMTLRDKMKVAKAAKDSQEPKA
jgi:hypothetical protein